MEVSRSRVVHADHAIVLAYVSDLRNDAEWRKLVTGSRLTAGTPCEVGATYEQTVNAMGRTSVTTATLRSVAGNCFTFDGAGMMAASFSVTAEPHADGAEVTLYFSAELPPPMAKMATKGIGADMEADLSKLATVVEQ
jgi:carbon monoxide dehydrogenase subunit G